MKQLLAILIVFSLHGCVTHNAIPVKGIYTNEPFTTETDNSFDYVWDKLIDFFAQRGLPIKIIDRSSGLIISEKTLLKATNETKDIYLKDSTAWVVVPKEFDMLKNKYVALASVPNIYGEWNVRIKTVFGKTVINVNLVNIQSERITPPFDWYLRSDCKTTGVLEKSISDLIK